MGDYREDLKREVERHRLPDSTFDEVSRRRQRRRRNRQIGTALIAVLVAAAGSFGLYRVVGGTGEPAGQPSITSSIIPTPSFTTPAPTAPSPSPSVTAPPIVGVLAPAVSGPIQFFDSSRGWMVGENAELLGTTDGGRVWTRIEFEFSPLGIQSVDFVDPDHGWVLAEAAPAGNLFRTSDGGHTWSPAGDVVLSTVQFLTPESGWGIERVPQFPENLGRLVHTNDGGLTWTTPDQAPQPKSVCFTDESHGWAAGAHEAGAALFRTDDAGASWNEIPVPIPGGDQGWEATVRCSDGGPWLLVTDGGAAGHTAYVVFRLGDAGPVAVLQEAGTHPMGLDQGIPEATNPQPGPLVAFDGSVAAGVTSCPPCGGDLASVSFESTHDGGATWDHPTVFGSNPPGEPLGVSFIDSDHGWVLLSVNGEAGAQFKVLVTTDGGQTWAEP